MSRSRPYGWCRSGSVCSDGEALIRSGCKACPSGCTHLVMSHSTRRIEMPSSAGFMHRGPISPRVHGTLDYLLAATLIAGPLVLHFDDDTAKAFVLSSAGPRVCSRSGPRGHAGSCV